jgi:hypothetical protein
MNNELESTSPRNGRGQARKEEVVTGGVYYKNNRNYLSNQVARLGINNRLRFVIATAYEDKGYLEVQFGQDDALIAAYEGYCLNQNRPTICVNLRGNSGMADVIIDWSTFADRQLYITHSADAVQFLRQYAGQDSTLGDSMVTNLRLDKAREVARLMVEKFSEWSVEWT